MRKRNKKKIIGWWIGSDFDWAFRHIAEEVMAKLPGYLYAFNELGDINMVMSPVYLNQIPSDKMKTVVLHMDGNRFYATKGIEFNLG